ncbi:hypothetical protein BPOR_0017g00020 [Botrytis porri]|uniref:Uncharacterized protein n=1 Tax=Botrytis porri TaxID=87229 RepID=A0A4Z1L4S6_9HELO|nr:hypothetical protein BPOR_0017g00020 [Botrytis porri]
MSIRGKSIPEGQQPSPHPRKPDQIRCIVLKTLPRKKKFKQLSRREHPTYQDFVIQEPLLSDCGISYQELFTNYIRLRSFSCYVVIQSCVRVNIAVFLSVAAIRAAKIPQSLKRATVAALKTE